MRLLKILPNKIKREKEIWELEKRGRKEENEKNWQKEDLRKIKEELHLGKATFI